MDDRAPEDPQELLRPIASLISKSEKAQGKLAPGTWQHTMLGENLKALHIALELMTEGADAARGLAPDDLRAALEALVSMIERTERSQTKFSPGTSQHTLQRNRLRALRHAETVTKAALEDAEKAGDTAEVDAR